MSDDDLVERAARRIWELRMKRWAEKDPSGVHPMLTWDNDLDGFKDDLREDVRAVLDEQAKQKPFHTLSRNEDTSAVRPEDEK